MEGGVRHSVCSTLHFELCRLECNGKDIGDFLDRRGDTTLEAPCLCRHFAF